MLSLCTQLHIIARTLSDYLFLERSRKATAVAGRSTQIDTITMMASECQKIVARHDELLFKIKALAATLWAAASGWAISSESAELLFVSLFVVAGLWFVAATFRGAQKRYIQRSDALHQFLMDAGALTEFESGGDLPDGVPRSLGGYEPRLERAKLLIRGFVSPTVSAFYSFFCLISVLLYVELQ
jgi:hypothetical protein